MKELWGNIVYYFAKFLEAFYNIIYKVAEFIVDAADSIKAFFIPVLLLIGFSFFAFPLMLIFVFSGPGLGLVTIFLIVIAISIIGRAGLNAFRKIKYAQIKFLYDYARFYKEGGPKYKSYDFYKKDYDRIQREKIEEELRREEERRRQRQKAQEEQWKAFFEQNFGGYAGGGYSGQQRGYNQGGYRPGGSGQFSSFKKQYEEACDVLGVPYKSDFDTIKAAYRKLAKKYHPDISNERNAEEMFKKVNNAYDFLSEENVKRYNSMY